MCRIIRYVLLAKNHGLRLLPHWHRTWELVAYSDSDYASDKETRRSLYGYFVYCCGTPIAWRSRGMRSEVLATTEAEYITLSEVEK